MSRVVRARSRLNVLREEAADSAKALEVLQERLARLTENKRKLELAIGELGKKIEGLPLEEIAERERSRLKLDQKVQQKNQDLGGVRAKLHELTSDKLRLDQELERSARSNRSAQRLLNRRNLLLRAGELLNGLLQQYEVDARNTIQEQINEILSTVAHRDYKCRLNPNFSIDLTFSNGLPTPKSGGENQLLSLVFIASLVKFAASRIDDESLILKPGTVAPLVLDAPFGQLDMSYQKDVASYIPQLAEQIVLLVTSSQGNERVLEALQPYIGAEYLLFSENKGPRGTKNEMRIPIHGKEHVCSLFNQQRTMTRIERIS
jgi:DNA sulfur modification protein DndD